MNMHRLKHAARKHKHEPGFMHSKLNGEQVSSLVPGSFQNAYTLYVDEDVLCQQLAASSDHQPIVSEGRHRLGDS